MVRDQELADAWCEEHGTKLDSPEDEQDRVNYPKLLALLPDVPPDLPPRPGPEPCGTLDEWHAHVAATRAAEQLAEDAAREEERVGRDVGGATRDGGDGVSRAGPRAVV